MAQMSQGIVKSLTKSGSLRIPVEMMRKIGLRSGDDVVLSTGADEMGLPALFLRKLPMECSICQLDLEGESGDIVELPNLCLCARCAKILEKEGVITIETDD